LQPFKTKTNKKLQSVHILGRIEIPDVAKNMVEKQKVTAIFGFTIFFKVEIYLNL
jgi:6,7-dimethyl-8-ribityllumazine synthase